MISLYPEAIENSIDSILQMERHLPYTARKRASGGTSCRRPIILSQSCPSCRSANQRGFNSEVNIHFPGMKGLNIPTVWVFPKISVCMDCGTAQFTIPDAERKELKEIIVRPAIESPPGDSGESQ